jgi:hypothetical protein
MSWD